MNISSGNYFLFHCCLEQCGDSHVLGCVGESCGVLRRCVLWPVGGGVTDDHHHWPVRIDFLGHPEVIDAVVGYQVCQIVLRKNEVCYLSCDDF